MMRYLPAILMLMFWPPQPGAAQQADSKQRNRADSLRSRIEERFASRVQEELGLTDQQTSRLRATSQKFGQRRRELRSRERELREALSSQLQPGVAARPDSVTKLTDAMIELKLAAAQVSRDEMREVSQYLNPVQRARLFVMRERFDQRVKHFHGRGHHGRGHPGRRRVREQWM